MCDGTSDAEEQTRTAGLTAGKLRERAILLTIAGFDPSSGAGVTADLKVFAAHGGYGMACITALTVQSTQGVRGVEVATPGTVEATLGTLAEDVHFSAIKVGMLANGQIAEIVNKFLSVHLEVPVVLDPVMRSSSGRDLLDSGGLRVLREKLLARVNWITPNLEELAALTGSSVIGKQDVPPAAEKLREQARSLGNPGLSIVVTGGHLDPPDDYLLDADGKTFWIPGHRIETRATHGTGCAFSSALLCRVAEGESSVAAVTLAKSYVAAALQSAYPIGRGRGPMNHLYSLRRALE